MPRASGWIDSLYVRILAALGKECGVNEDRLSEKVQNVVRMWDECTE